MARLAVHSVSALVGGRVSPDRKRVASLASATFGQAELRDPPHKTEGKKKLLAPAAPLIRCASPHLDRIESTVAVERNGPAYNGDGKSAWQRQIYPIPKLNDLKTQTAEDLRHPAAKINFADSGEQKWRNLESQ